MTIEERKLTAKEPIVWFVDLKDDCSARWAGLLLRAEWMDKKYWWWCVYDMMYPKEPQIDASNNYNESCKGGEKARMKAETAARKYIRELISNRDTTTSYETH